mmetsp:Transcript_43693/g.115533  ORF Transcript_43693/g.115533 Transcript_43693/m.115533 type:complete len:232 (+) Transcript_43693:155-850(+)
MQAWVSTCQPRTSPGAEIQRHVAERSEHVACENGSCEWKTAWPMTLQSREAATQARMVSGRPLDTKSLTRSGRASSCDFASTTTLDGIAVGIMKAREQPTVAGSRSIMGFSMDSIEEEDSAVSIVEAVPMPENTWVAMAMMPMMMNCIPRDEWWAVSFAKPSPSAMLRPDSEKPWLMAKLPPISRIMPKSKCSCTACHVRTDWPGRSTDGMKKSRTAGAQARVASLTRLLP